MTQRCFFFNALALPGLLTVPLFFVCFQIRCLHHSPEVQCHEFISNIGTENFHNVIGTCNYCCYCDYMVKMTDQKSNGIFHTGSNPVNAQSLQFSIFYILKKKQFLCFCQVPRFVFFNLVLIKQTFFFYGKHSFNACVQQFKNKRTPDLMSKFS